MFRTRLLSSLLGSLCGSTAEIKSRYSKVVVLLHVWWVDWLDKTLAWHRGCW
jgi:hypothetical protein